MILTTVIVSTLWNWCCTVFQTLCLSPNPIRATQPCLININEVLSNTETKKHWRMFVLFVVSSLAVFGLPVLHWVRGFCWVSVGCSRRSRSGRHAIVLSDATSPVDVLLQQMSWNECSNLSWFLSANKAYTFESVDRVLLLIFLKKKTFSFSIGNKPKTYSIW